MPLPPKRRQNLAKTGTPDTQSPDASLTADESFTATSSAGLTYPWGDFEPGKGSVHPIAPGIGWARIPMPGSLGHINSWLLDDHDGVAVVDTGLLLEECSGAWKAIFAQDLAGKPITRVIGTHLHPDHIGLAGWLCKRSGTELWMTRGEWLTARMLIGDVRDTPPNAYAERQRAAGLIEVIADDPRRDTNRRGTGRHSLDHHRIGAHTRPCTDGKATQHLGAGTDHHIISNGWMALATTT